MSSASDQQIQALQKYITALEAERDQWKAEARSAAKTLQALRELANRGLGKK